MGVTNLVLVSSEEDDSCESETVALGKAEVLRAFLLPRAVAVVVVVSRFLVFVRRDTAMLRGTASREPLRVLGVTQYALLLAADVPLRLGDVLSEAFVVLSRLLTRVGIAAVAGLASALFCVLAVVEALAVEFFRVLVELARDVVLLV
jgi:hypothetical protein